MTEINLLTNDEAAKILRLAPATLVRWRVRSRKLGPKYIKIGRDVYYDSVDVWAWVESQKRDPNPPQVDAQPKVRKEKMADRLRETLNLPRVPRGRVRKELLCDRK